MAAGFFFKNKTLMPHQNKLGASMESNRQTIVDE